MKKLISAVLTAIFAVSLILFSHAEEVPVISEMPLSVTASVGEAVLLSCVAQDPADEASVKYVWYRATSPDNDGEAVTEAQSIGTYQPSTDFPYEFYYYCVVYYIYEETSTHAKSDVVTVTVEGNVNIEKPVIVTDIEPSYSIPQGGELIISVECEPQTAPIVISYQWYSKHPSEKVFNKVSDAKENTLKVSSDSVGTMQYFCMVTASYGGRSSNTQSTITRVEVYSHDHTFGEWSVTVSPTCMTAGEEQRSCECGAVEKNVLNILGHSFGEWTVTRRPTAYAEGEKSRTCSECGISEVRSISPIETVTEQETTAAPEESESEPESASDTVTTTSVPQTEKYQPQNGFPWWNAILIFGILSTVGSAAAAFYFIRRSDAIIKDERKRILRLRAQAKNKQEPK